jgi:hypothetical protein
LQERYGLAGSTTKKAILRRFDKEPLIGYVNPLSFLGPTGVELLSPESRATLVPYAEIKTVSFVRDFEGASEPGRRVFYTRPKMEGLWVAFELRDGEAMEGVLINNLLQWEPYGFTVIPPDPYGNHQRIFVPRAALRSAEVLGVVGSPLRKRAKAVPKEQITLFDE